MRRLSRVTFVAALAAAGVSSLLVSASAQTPAAPAAQTPGAGQPNAPSGNVATSPDVNLSPKRVVIGDGRRTGAEIIVFNRGTAEATYSIDLVDRVMMPEGGLKELERATPEEKARLKSAKEMIRYSPRRVTLKPGEAQTVRIQLRRPAGLAAGEYRTHFSVAAVPPQDTGLDIAQAAGAANPDEIRIRLVPVFGISIPIIVREGELPVEASINDVRMTRRSDTDLLQMTLNRKGARSMYGDVEVFLLGSGAPRRVAEVRGVGVYPELDSRRLTVPLLPNAPKLAAGSKLRVVFTDDDFRKGTVLAQTETALP